MAKPLGSRLLVDVFEKLSFRSRALHSVCQFEFWLAAQQEQALLSEISGLEAITAKLQNIVKEALFVIKETKEISHAKAYFSALGDLALHYEPAKANRLLTLMATQYIPQDELSLDALSTSQRQKQEKSLFETINVRVFVCSALEFLLSLVSLLFMELSPSKTDLSISWDLLNLLLYRLNTVFKNTVEPGLESSGLDTHDTFSSFLVKTVLNPFLYLFELSDLKISEQWEQLWESAGLQEQDYRGATQKNARFDKAVQTINLERKFCSTRSKKMEAIHESPELRRVKTYDEQNFSQSSMSSYTTPKISSRDLWHSQKDMSQIKFEIPKKTSKKGGAHCQGKGIIRRLLEQRDEEHKLTGFNKRIAAEH